MLGECAEFRSDATLLGWPLVHIVSQAHRQGRKKTARGWIAIGPKAIGGIAIGGFAGGIFAMGGFSISVVGASGFSLGLLAFGGLAAGGFAFGGLSAGYAAVGGLAVGQYACGGAALGTYVISQERKDPEAVAFFQEHEWTFSLLPNGANVRERLLQQPPESK